MSMFREISVLSEIESGAPLSPYAKSYVSGRVRNSFYDYIMRKFQEAEEKHGLTKSKLAERLGYDKARISRVLGEPNNLTLETAAELLLGISYEELIPFSESLIGRAKSNYDAHAVHAASIEKKFNRSPDALDALRSRAEATNANEISSNGWRQSYAIG